MDTNAISHSLAKGGWAQTIDGLLKAKTFGSQVGAIWLDLDHYGGGRKYAAIHIAIDDAGALSTDTIFQETTTGRVGLAFLRWVASEIQTLQKEGLPAGQRFYGLGASPSDDKRKGAYRWLTRIGFRWSEKDYTYFYTFSRKVRKRMRSC
jgi:hypothetical protein